MKMIWVFGSVHAEIHIVPRSKMSNSVDLFVVLIWINCVWFVMCDLSVCCWNACTDGLFCISGCHSLTGCVSTHKACYVIKDFSALYPVLVCVCVCVGGLAQLIYSQTYFTLRASFTVSAADVWMYMHDMTFTSERLPWPHFIPHIAAVPPHQRQGRPISSPEGAGSAQGCARFTAPCVEDNQDWEAVIKWD